MEINRNIKYQCEESGAEEEDESHGGEHIPILEQAWWECGIITLPPLRKTEDYYHSCEADEEADDSGVGPCVCGSSPLEGEEEHDDCWDEDCCADQVELADTPDDALAGGIVFAVDVEVEEYACYDNCANWEAKTSY